MSALALYNVNALGLVEVYIVHNTVTETVTCYYSVVYGAV